MREIWYSFTCIAHSRMFHFRIILIHRCSFETTIWLQSIKTSRRSRQNWQLIGINFIPRLVILTWRVTSSPAGASPIDRLGKNTWANRSLLINSEHGTNYGIPIFLSDRTDGFRFRRWTHICWLPSQTIASVISEIEVTVGDGWCIAFEVFFAWKASADHKTRCHGPGTPALVL
jgi:hypothetical protein